jgi:hypothetical protein
MQPTTKQVMEEGGTCFKMVSGLSNTNIASRVSAEIDVTNDKLADEWISIAIVAAPFTSLETGEPVPYEMSVTASGCNVRQQKATDCFAIGAMRTGEDSIHTHPAPSRSEGLPITPQLS